MCIVLALSPVAQIVVGQLPLEQHDHTLLFFFDLANSFELHKCAFRDVVASY